MSRASRSAQASASARGGDQILAHLDQRVGETARRRDVVDHVAFERAVIGLVVADRSRAARSASRGERSQQRLRQPRVAVPQHADLPRPRGAAPERREGMDRHDGWRDARRRHRLDRLGDRVAIGRPVERAPARDLRRVDPRVAGHDRPVGQAHHQRRIVGAAVGIDQQAREGRQHRRRAEPLGEAARQPGRADVIGDMPLERLARQAEAVDIRRAGRWRRGRRSRSRRRQAPRRSARRGRTPPGRRRSRWLRRRACQPLA